MINTTSINEEIMNYRDKRIFLQNLIPKTIDEKYLHGIDMTDLETESYKHIGTVMENIKNHDKFLDKLMIDARKRKAWDELDLLIGISVKFDEITKEKTNEESEEHKNL
jgi:N-acetylneuraminic acid mutarotase